MAKYNVWLTVEAPSLTGALNSVLYGYNEDGIDGLVSIDNVSEVEE